MDGELRAASRRNTMLANLGTVAATRLQSCLTYIKVAAGDVLETPGQPPPFLFFPDTALVSFVAHGFDGQRIGIATVGHGGVTGIGFVLGSPLSAHEVTVEVAGTGWRLAATDCRHLLGISEEIRTAFLRLTSDHLDRVARTALAAGRLEVPQLVVHWLLAASEALGQPVVPITHERLAVLLGVRRPSITVALGALEAVSLLRTNRGMIEITDRTGLSKLSSDVRRGGLFLQRVRVATEPGGEDSLARAEG
jgi:CRP-like cAMP-binding protein